MTITRLNREERAFYALGQAILQVLRSKPTDPQGVQAIERVCRELESTLSADDIIGIAEETGYLIGGPDGVDVRKDGEGTFSWDNDNAPF